MNTESSFNPEQSESLEARHARLAETVYQSALNEPRNKANYERLLRENPEKEQEIREVIDTVLKEMEQVEAAAGIETVVTALTPEIAKNIAAIWDISGSGNYNQPVGNDPYKDIAWAQWSDKKRLDYSAWLVRKISEIRAYGSAAKQAMDKDQTRELIKKFGPPILYGAYTDMNEVVKEVSNKPGTIIPPEKVIIDDEEKLSTLEQVKNFELPEQLHEPGKEIGIVSHGPQLVRFLHMQKRYQTLPKDMVIRLFPLKTKEGWEDYALTETRGLLYYIYLSKGHDAAKEPYPNYIVHGQKSETPPNLEQPESPEKKDEVPFYKNVVVLSSFESPTHKSGLDYNTRLRLIAAALDYKAKKTEKIIVSGPKIRDMDESFAQLMKQVLIEKYHIPENAIETEDQALDTASQVEWTKHNLEQLKNDAAFITDPDQAKHLQALLVGYNIHNLEILTTDDIIKKLIPNSTRLENFLTKLRKSPEGIKFKIREQLLTFLTKTIDQQGRKLQKITRLRRPN